jgi:hypothetical protein
MTKYPRSNSEDWMIKDLGVSTREQTWEINYAHIIFRAEVAMKYRIDNDWYKTVSPYKACVYKRSENLCRNHLLSVGLITENNVPVMPAIKKIAEQYALEPAFKNKILNPVNSWQGETIRHPSQAYVNYLEMKPREFFHVYCNKNQYDLYLYRAIEKHDHRDRSGFSHFVKVEVVKLKVFPKVAVKALHTELAVAKMDKFLKEHVQFASKAIQDLDLQHLSNDREKR